MLMVQKTIRFGKYNNKCNFSASNAMLAASLKYFDFWPLCSIKTELNSNDVSRPYLLYSEFYTNINNAPTRISQLFRTYITISHLFVQQSNYHSNWSGVPIIGHSQTVKIH